MSEKKFFADEVNAGEAISTVTPQLQCPRFGFPVRRRSVEVSCSVPVGFHLSVEDKQVKFITDSTFEAFCNLSPISDCQEVSCTPFYTT